MKCIIEEKIIVDQKVFDAMETERHIAGILGEQPRKIPRAVHYRNRESNEKYLCLAGGFAWPGAKPGFALVLAVEEGANGEEPLYRVLAEREDHDLYGLLRQSCELFQLYGRGCREIPWFWYGDPNSGLNGFVLKFNKQQERQGNETPFLLAPAPHLGEPGCFEFYCRTIHSFLQNDNKRLALGPCGRLRGYLDHLTTENVVNGTIGEHPAIAATGYAISALDMYEPWLMDLSIPLVEGNEDEDWCDIYNP